MTKLLKDLNSQQIAAVQHTEGPCLIVAGPGSGKTRVLTHRAAYLIQQNLAAPEEILLVTFTNKSADEMKERVHKLLQEHFPKDVPPLPWVGTFHATGAKILRRDGREIEVSPNFVIYDEADSQRLIKKILKKLDIPEEELRPGAVLGTIESAKHELIDAASYQNYAYGPFQNQVARIYPEYQKNLQENGALDFGDLIFKTVELLQLHPEVLKKWRDRFRYILVDEYQDTNRAQYTLVKLLAEKHRNLCVVGDVSQAIYGWRGADFKNVLNFEKDWPEVKIFRLEQNYRSTETIVRAAKEVIEHNRTHIALNLRTENALGEKIKIYEAKDEQDEARQVVREIRDIEISGDQNTDFAILYRTNAQSRVLEETLVREGLSYQLIGGVKFYDRREIKDILSYLRVIANPRDRLSLERIINIPPRGIGKKSQEKLAARNWNLADVAKILEFPLQEFINRRETLVPLETMDKILEQTGYLGWLDDGSEENLARIENVKELRSVAAQFENLQNFLENVALVQNGYTPKGKLPASTRPERSPELAEGRSRRVTLMTLHAAKGLEFPAVFIVG
ncbi:UvrD-helicase domain-containing protein, partial [Candidatus Parcubacteria bacterium]|nr:UvrD-helicase domain-containing protein [Candidatus Parcubacteria bacterium]